MITTQFQQIKKAAPPHMKGDGPRASDRPKPESEELVKRINSDELKNALKSPTVLLDLLHRYKAPPEALKPRVKDDATRKLHANARSASEAINAAVNRDALVSALRVATGLSKQASLVDMLLCQLGSYDLRKGPNGRAIDAFFWSRDRGVQAYIEQRGIAGVDTSVKLKDLGGVDATYRLWCEEKKGSSGLKAAGTQRGSLEKATLEKVAELKVGERVCIEAELVKPKKLKFIGIHKCVPEVEGEIVAETPPTLPVMPALPAPASPAGPTGAH